MCKKQKRAGIDFAGDLRRKNHNGICGKNRLKAATSKD